MSTASSRVLDEVQVGVRVKISSLWIAMLFLFAYGDIFGFFKPGQIQDVISGEVSGIKITQAFLLGASIYIAVASVMVFLTLVLKAAASRWTNIVLAVLFIVSIVVSVIGETWAYFIFLSVAEVGLLLLIVRYAWTWPSRDGAPPS
jgi:Family of unknown function (DUF6326)